MIPTRTTYRSTTIQALIKFLVCIFFFPVGLLILLWRGQIAETVPVVHSSIPVGWYSLGNGFEVYWNGLHWDYSSKRKIA